MANDIRYVTDVPYIAGFTAELAPEWLDFVAVLSGFRPPRRDDGFAWCELGCGPGMAPIIFAATHPAGRFHGIDAMPDHIGRGSRISERAGLDNLNFHALDFAAACDLDLPKFQYIVAHGVYAWIDEKAAADLRRFIDRHLAPGGLVYVSYNAMPGWAADGPFQHLVYALAATERGNSVDKFAAATARLKKLLDAGAAALRASPAAVAIEEQKARRPQAYFAHEYLAPAWRPLYVDDVRREMAGIGLSPIGSATLRDNFDSFVLRRAARDALQEIEDPDQRELARDYFMEQSFRRDLYGRGVDVLDENERRERLLAGHYAMMRPASLVEFAMGTEAGRLSFDNPVARHIVSVLAAGPRRLQDCSSETISGQDLLANALVLCCAGILSPVTARPVAVDSLNEILLDVLDSKTEATFHVSPHGMVLRFEGGLLAALRDGKPIPETVQPWADFLQALR